MPGPSNFLDNVSPQDAAILQGGQPQQPEAAPEPPVETPAAPPAEGNPPVDQAPVVQEEAAPQEQPAEGAPSEAPAEPETEDPGFDESQAHLFEDYQEAAPEAPAVEGSPSIQTPAATPDTDIFKQLSERLGREVKSVDDVFSAERALVPNFEGYSAETSKLIDASLESGLLDPESIATGKLQLSWADNPVDNLVYDALVESQESLGRDTDEQTIQDLMDDMTPAMRQMQANIYAKSKEMEARQQLMEVRQAMQRDEMVRQESVRAQQAQRNQFFSQVDTVAKSMETIPGTPVQLTPEMQVGIAKITKSVIDLPKDSPIRQLLGNPSDGQKGIEKAFTQISRLMYAGTIQRVLASSAKSAGIRQAIDSSTKAATQAPAPGAPVGDQRPVNVRANQENALDNWFAGKR